MAHGDRKPQGETREPEKRIFAENRRSVAKSTNGAENHNLKPKSLRLLTDDHTPPLGLSERRSKLFWLIVVAEILIVVRYSFILYVWSPYSAKTPVITSINSLSSSRDFICEQPKLVQGTSNSSTDCVDLESREGIERLVYDKYAGFNIWNTSRGYKMHDPLFEVILLEQADAMQLIYLEARVAVHLMAASIVCIGIVGGLVGSYKPFDVPATLFIFEPEFSAFKMRRGVSSYLETVRDSYLNLWSTHELSPDGTMYSRTLESPTHERRAQGGSFHSNYMQLQSYLPSARSQSWRKVLLALQPSMMFGNFILILTTLLVLYILRVSQNRTTVETNRQLKLFLSGEIELIDGQSVNKTCHQQAVNWTQVNQSFRQILTERLMTFASSVNPNMFEAMRLSSGEEDPQLVLANSLSPISIPKLWHWILATVSMSTMVLLILSYSTMYLVSIFDLSVWLVELQMKLNIYKSVLKRYESMGPFERAPAASDLSPSERFGQRWSAASKFRLLNMANFGDSFSNCTNNCPQETTTGRLSGGPSELTMTVAQLLEARRLACNLELSRLYEYLFARRREKEELCHKYASYLIELDSMDTIHSARRMAHKFLFSAYLDFRLFRDQIEASKRPVSYIIGFAVVNSLNMVVACTQKMDTYVKLGIMLGAFVVSNLHLFGASFFQSQCAKLHDPIYSILAASLRADKEIHHLALLWRKCLTDMEGSRSKFAFRIYSVRVSYATTLQVSCN